MQVSHLTSAGCRTCTTLRSVPAATASVRAQGSPMGRRFVALPKEDQDRLAEQFATLPRLIAAEEVGNYQHQAVSVFDHILSVEEAKTQLDDIDPSHAARHDTRLHEFACTLSARSDCYLVKLKGRRKKGRLTFRAFTSAEAKERSLLPLPYMVSDHFRFILVFPSLDLVYLENADFTHHLYYKRAGSLELVVEAT